MAEKNETIDQMKMETTADLHQMHKRFSEKEACLLAADEKKVKEIVLLKQQLASESLPTISC